MLKGHNSIPAQERLPDQAQSFKTCHFCQTRETQNMHAPKDNRSLAMVNNMNAL